MNIPPVTRRRPNPPGRIVRAIVATVAAALILLAIYATLSAY